MSSFGVSLFALYCFEYRVCVLFLQWVSSLALYSPGVVCVLFGYKVRVLSYASGAFPCIVCVGVLVLHVALLHVLLGNWAVGLVTKVYLPAVWFMGGP